MKKNGFTLIELLAVIIILGILMIIAIPSVTRYIGDSRKKVYVDTAKEVIGSARMLSLGDVLKACLGNSYSNSGYLFNCHFLMENIGQYEKDNGTRSYGYWLETPDSTNSNKVYNVNGIGSTVRSSEANSTEYYGVRPVITIATSDLGQ